MEKIRNYQKINLLILLSFCIFSCSGSTSNKNDNLDEKIKGTPILLKNKELEVNRVMSNSFGFGGTNACLIFEKQT